MNVCSKYGICLVVCLLNTLSAHGQVDPNKTVFSVWNVMISDAVITSLFAGLNKYILSFCYESKVKVNAAICIAHHHEHVSDALPLPVSRRWSLLARHQPGISEHWDHVHGLVCHVICLTDFYRWGFAYDLIQIYTFTLIPFKLRLSDLQVPWSFFFYNPVLVFKVLRLSLNRVGNTWQRL